MLVLKLKPKSRTTIGGKVFQVISVYRNSACVKLNGQTFQIIPEGTKISNETTVKFLRKQGKAAAFAFDSPEEIWRVRE